MPPAVAPPTPSPGSVASLLPALGQRTLVMGVLNVTPDSFSDGGQHATVEAAVEHALQMRADGADIVDVGGATTRPGSLPVPVPLELARVLPVISALRARGIGPLSIDTTSAEVADQALAAGAHLVNDISGGSFEPEILAVARAHRAPIVLMHTRARPQDMQRGPWTYEGGVVAAVRASLEAACARAEAAGLAPDALVLDPGIGFGKTLEENLALLAGLPALVALGRPVLVGTSRKSFLGKLTGREVGDRVHATGATVALAVAKGAALVRVHDVAAMVDVVKVADAIMRRP